MQLFLNFPNSYTGNSKHYASLLYASGKIWATVWAVRRVSARTKIEGSRNINWTRMAEEKNANEGKLETWCFLCLSRTCLRFHISSFLCLSLPHRYQKRREDWKRMKKKPKRCGKENGIMRQNGKEQEKKGYVSILFNFPCRTIWHGLKFSLWGYYSSSLKQDFAYNFICLEGL